MRPDSSPLLEREYFDNEFVEVAKSHHELQELLDGLRWQLERRSEELRRVQERFEAASRARDLGESDERGGRARDGEEGTTAGPRASRSLLRAEASLAQLELNTVRNQVEYLTGLIGRIQRRAELVASNSTAR